MMPREKLLADLLPDLQGIADDLRVTGLVMDSREVEPGNAFVAIEGFGAHGLHFVDKALEQGAAAILFEPPAPADLQVPADAIAVPGLRSRLGAMANQFHDEPSAAMTMVGVTGTNGKTSSTQLIAQAWELIGKRAATIGTLGAGLVGDVQPTGFTTPLVLRVHALLADLRDAGAQAVAMEVSSHALDQGRVDGVEFDIAVFTNLTRDHLDYHGDMESYGAAKKRLFDWPTLSAAVINVDDAFGDALARDLPLGLEAWRFSVTGNPLANIRAENLELDAQGIHFDLSIHGEAHAVHSPLLGRFNVENLLAVAGVMSACGMPVAKVAELLSQLQPIHGRMNRLGGEGLQPTVVIDYAHTPDALQQALASLSHHVQGELVCIFGCGGDRDKGKRPQMAAIAELDADIVIVTDDNPRTENGDAIVAEILEGFAEPGKVRVIRDRGLAIRTAIEEAGPDDIILIAGKGHEPYQEINGVRHDFDDTATARDALERVR